MKESIYAIIKKPILTEKTKRLAKEGQYVFEVKKDANKKEIKEAIEKIFGVKVEKVRVLKIPSKPRVFRGKLGEKKGYKKAIVKLEEGQKIEIFE